jgi:hypothetical protein
MVFVPADFASALTIKRSTTASMLQGTKETGTDNDLRPGTVEAQLAVVSKAKRACRRRVAWHDAKEISMKQGTAPC